MFFERIIVINKDIENCLGIKKTYLRGNIIFQISLYFFIKRGQDLN